MRVDLFLKNGFLKIFYWKLLSKSKTYRKFSRNVLSLIYYDSTIRVLPQGQNYYGEVSDFDKVALDLTIFTLFVIPGLRLRNHVNIFKVKLPSFITHFL